LLEMRENNGSRPRAPRRFRLCRHRREKLRSRRVPGKGRTRVPFPSGRGVPLPFRERKKRGASSGKRRARSASREGTAAAATAAASAPPAPHATDADRERRPRGEIVDQVGRDGRPVGRDSPVAASAVALAHHTVLETAEHFLGRMVIVSKLACASSHTWPKGVGEGAAGGRRE